MRLVSLQIFKTNKPDSRCQQETQDSTHDTTPIKTLGLVSHGLKTALICQGLYQTHQKTQTTLLRDGGIFKCRARQVAAKCILPVVPAPDLSIAITPRDDESGAPFCAATPPGGSLTWRGPCRSHITAKMLLTAIMIGLPPEAGAASTVMLAVCELDLSSMQLVCGYDWERRSTTCRNN